MRNLQILIAFVTVVYGAQINLVQTQVQLRVIRQWKYLNYTWPNEDVLQNAMGNGTYIPENIVTSGIMYYDDWFYLTMPRMRPGVPATLGRITARQGGSTAPLIQPYPSWEFNTEGNCNALQNVQNLEISPTGEMWIIDGGHTSSLTPNPVKNCPPKLILYDVNGNKTILVYTFPETVANRNGSFLYDLVVDGDYVYITDNSAHDPGIIVFSRTQNKSWKIRHSISMRADATAQDFRVNSVLISAPINVAGIALGPKITSTGAGNSGIQVNEDREVFYCPLSSLHLYSISTSILRNESNANNGQDYPGEVKDVGLKASQTDGMIMTNQGVLFYGLLADNSIARWDSRTPFASGQKVVSKDPAYIQWTNSFTMDPQGNLTVLTDTLQKFIYGKLDLNQPNFWLLTGQVGGKNYLYDDSSFNYSPVTESSTVTQKMAVTNMTTTGAPEPSSPITVSSATTANGTTTTASPSPAGANLRVFELRLLVLTVVIWLLYR